MTSELEKLKAAAEKEHDGCSVSALIDANRYITALESELERLREENAKLKRFLAVEKIFDDVKVGRDCLDFREQIRSRLIIDALEDIKQTHARGVEEGAREAWFNARIGWRMASVAGAAESKSFEQFWQQRQSAKGGGNE